MDRIDEYVVQGELGRGAMGVVYRALDPTTGQTVAIKLMSRAGAAVPVSVARFERECQATLRLRHPNIISVLKAGSLGSVPYLVLELVEGLDLDQRLREGPLPPREAAEVGVQIAAALDHAHHRKVLHRDLKPANVMLHPVRGALLADFGLAKVFGTQGGQSLTQSNDLLGSPAYMSPEQASADHARVGERTDVYGLGAVLYEALTGQPPCWGSTLVEVLHKIENVVPDRPSALVAGVPPALDKICLKCLAKDPAKRYESADAVEQALSAFLEERDSGRGKPLALALGALTLTFGLGVGVSALLIRDSPQPAPSATSLAKASPAKASPSPSEPLFASPTPSAPEPASSPRSPLPFDDLELTSDERWTPEEKAEFLVRAEAAAAAQPSAPAFTDVARACLGTGDLERARAAIKRALELDTEYPTAYRIRGLISMRSRGGSKPGPFGDLLQTSARRDFERALELDPGDWQALRERAVVRSNLGDTAGAEADFSARIERNPTAEAYNARAYFEASQGRIKSAQADFERSLELDPRNLNALQNLTGLARNAGDARAASDYLTRQLEITPRSLPALKTQVVLLALLKEYKRVIETALVLEEVAPSDPEGPMRRAFAHQNLGELGASRAPLERLLALEPTHPEGLLMMLRVLINAQDWAAVVKVCDRLLAIRPSIGEPNLSEVKQNRAYALRALATPSSTPR